MTSERTKALEARLKKLYYKKGSDLLFHGWHHIHLTARKAVEFAAEFEDVDVEIIEAAALVHDMNYLVEVNTGPEVGRELRQQYLSEADFTPREMEDIEHIIMEEHTANRHANISNSAKALSDADSLFKVMPLTPIIFSSHYIIENKVDINEWAEKIIKEQQPLMDQGIYFYTKLAKGKYQEWAEVDLKLVQQVSDSLKDPAIKEMFEIAKELGVV